MEGSQDGDSTRLGIRPYGSFRGHLAVFENEAEIQENASRIGFEIYSHYKGIRYFAGLELAVNLFRARQTLNADASTGSGFIQFDEADPIQVFSTRLGYLGADLGRYGVITIGKQWGVYYDITGYTDKFNVFGGQGSATYVAASDGGESGTGRANQAFIYRNRFGRLSVGGQFQMRSVTNEFFIDGFGFSAQFELLDGLKVGAAYNKAYFDNFLVENTIGFGGQPEYLSFGASYQSDTWYFGAVYVSQTNGDLRPSILDEELVAVIFDARGLEFIAKYKRPKFSLSTGFNGYYPEIENLPVDQNSRGEWYIFGAEFIPSRFAYFYGEYRYSNSINQFGVKAFSVFTLGIRVDVQRTWEKYL